MTIKNVNECIYKYPIINDIPASTECVGMVVKTLAWGNAKVIGYKNSKTISILFLNSGAVEVVQKAALETGNVRDSVEGTFNHQFAKDNAILAKCNEQLEKLKKKARQANARIASRRVNRKVRIKRAYGKYDINKEENTCS